MHCFICKRLQATVAAGRAGIPERRARGLGPASPRPIVQPKPRLARRTSGICLFICVVSAYDTRLNKRGLGDSILCDLSSQFCPISTTIVRITIRMYVQIVCACNYHSYIHLILALGIVKEPTVWLQNTPARMTLTGLI